MHGSVVDHGAALALHSCPDCSDGFAPAFAGHTADQARAAVNAWLRAPDEPDGYKPCPLCGSTIPDEPTELDDLRAEVERLRSEVERERAAVVATLRRASRYRFPAAGGLSPGGYIEVVLDLIQRGQHRGTVA
jgi:hypothetical protein